MIKIEHGTIGGSKKYQHATKNCGCTSPWNPRTPWVRSHTCIIDSYIIELCLVNARITVIEVKQYDYPNFLRTKEAGQDRRYTHRTKIDGQWEAMNLVWFSIHIYIPPYLRSYLTKLLCSGAQEYQQASGRQVGQRVERNRLVRRLAWGSVENQKST